MADASCTPIQADTRQDMSILLPSGVLLFIIITLSVLYPERAESVLASIYAPFIAHTGIVYLWATFIMILTSVFFICSRYGNIRFGEPGEKPEFGAVTWIIMMFSAGVAGAVLFWSIVEPLSHISSPPLYAEPLSRAAYDWSLAYVLLHWGPITWPWYAVTALPICYMLYRKKKPVLRISAVAGPAIGEKAVQGWIGKVIEVFFVDGFIFSNTTVMSICVPIGVQAFAMLMGIQPTFIMQVILLAISMAIFILCSGSGLKQGIVLLSRAKVTIVILMIFYVLFAGPTSELLSIFTNAFGKMVGNWPTMLFWTSPWQKESFPQDWTIFYCLWMASYGPFMGLFIAKISRGRTIRQVLLMSILGGMAGAYFIHGVFGSYTLWAQHSGLIDAVSILKNKGGNEALISVLMSLPYSQILLAGYTLFTVIFIATNLNSSSYILACAATRRLTVGAEPTRGACFFWALVQGVLALTVISLGGMGAAKIFGNFSGAFMLVPICFAMFTLYKFVSEHDMVKEELNERRAAAGEKIEPECDPELDEQPEKA